MARLLNIDRLSGYSQGSEDSFVENATAPSSPFGNDTEFSTSSTTVGFVKTIKNIINQLSDLREINEILTRPLNSSDQPFEDKVRYIYLTYKRINF